MKKKHCIILGGGIAGLTLADQLSERGVDVTILERDGSLGGLARGVEIDGSRVDFGPHNLRTSNSEVMNYWLGLIGDDLEKKTFHAQIYFQGNLINYPIKPFELMTKLPVSLIFRSALALLKNRVLSKIKKPSLETFEDWLRHVYGEPLVKVFFRPFTEKIWGVPPSLMDINLAKQRIPPFSIRRTLFQTQPKGELHSEDPQNTRTFYPRMGVYQFCEKITCRLQSKSVQILMGVDVRSIQEKSDGVVVEIENRSNGARQTVEGDLVSSSIAISSLLKLYGNDNSESLPNLNYRGLGILFLSVPASVHAPVAFISCADGSIPFNRVTDFGACSTSMLAPEKNVIGVEFHVKTRNADDLKRQEQEIIESLRKTKIVDLSKVYATKIEIIPFVYPVYLKDYRQSLTDTFEFIRSKERLISFGRHGVFSHINIDQVMEQAFAVAHIASLDQANFVKHRDAFYSSNFLLR